MMPDLLTTHYSLLATVIAQAQPPDFGPWLANVFYATGFIAAVVVLWRHLRGAPSATEIAGQPLTVQLAADYATKDEHTELKLRVDEMGGEIREGFRHLESKRSISIAGVHEKLEKSIAALRMEIKSDIAGVHELQRDVLGAVRELKGRIETR